MKRFQSVDDYINAAEQWQEELIRLRSILQSTVLEETVKWGAPCYTHRGKLVVGLAGFQSYVGLWFHQGALLTDPDGVLINAQEGRTKAQRQWRFSNMKDIRVRRIKAYVKEAVELVESGREIKPDRSRPVEIPAELQQCLAEHPAAQQAFSELTTGRQRDYARYIDEAKRTETKHKRLQKILPMIRQGVGLNDKYRS